MRKWMYESVVATPTQAEKFAGRVFTTGTVEGTMPGDSPTRPFIVIRFSTNQQGMGPVKQQRVQVYVHDDATSMLTIDDFVGWLERHMPTQAPVKRGDGSVVMDCHWEDSSGDGFDDHYQTNTRFVTFLITYKDKP